VRRLRRHQQHSQVYKLFGWVEMLDTVPTLRSDLAQIADWVRQDPFHCDDETWENLEGMLTGNGLLCFRLQDEIGPLVFVRLDIEGEFARITMQFGPENEVSKRRLVVGLIKLGIPMMVKVAKNKGFKGLVFKSVSETLIAFGKRQGFVLDKDDDYVLRFNLEEEDGSSSHN
jgi:hypothetical protein